MDDRRWLCCIFAAAALLCIQATNCLPIGLTMPPCSCMWSLPPARPLMPPARCTPLLLSGSPFAHLHGQVQRRGAQSTMIQARKRRINIHFLARLLLGRPRECRWDKPRFSPYFTQWKPSLSLGQTQFVPGTIPGTKGDTKSLCVRSFCAFFAR